MDSETRNSIERAAQQARRLLDEEFSFQLEGTFDVFRDGRTPERGGAHLSASQGFQRDKIIAAIEHKRGGGMTAEESVADYVRDAAFTTINRFIALKMLEARSLVQECVTKGDQSSGYREFCGMAPGVALLPDGAGYRLYIESLFDEFSTEIKVLFDRRDAASALWPKKQAFDGLVAVLNAPDLAKVWSEDETIGWAYQYFNSSDERREMRESHAPESSRELAIRNQFFTPRYVVEFLVQNTLSALWLEMRRGRSAAQPTRSTAAATSFAYYAAASLPVIGVAEAYWPSSEANAVFMWMAAAALLSVPWFFCWTRKESLRPWTATVVLALSAVPPLCIIGWASPLLSAGVLFPDSAWLGIASALALPGLLIHTKTRTAAVVFASAASIFLNIHAKEKTIPTGWVGEMTRIHRPRKADDFADFAIEEELQRTAQSSRAKVLVFPEGAVRRWTDATDAFWAPTESHPGKTLLIGAGEPIPGSGRYYNAVIIVGDHAGPALHQRIPVPGGMWNPFHSERGVALNLLGPGTVDVGGQRAVVLVCYEQLLTWPMLRSAIERPTVLVAISNESWTAATRVPQVQHTCVRAWARLFGLPVISAINS